MAVLGCGLGHGATHHQQLLSVTKAGQFPLAKYFDVVSQPLNFAKCSKQIPQTRNRETTNSHFFDFCKFANANARLLAPRRPSPRLQRHAMARQFGRERRGDQDEKRQPYQNMIAPSPRRRKPLLMLPPCDCRGAAIGFRRIGCRQSTFIGLRGWATIAGCGPLPSLYREHFRRTVRYLQYL